MMRRGKELAVG